MTIPLLALFATTVLVFYIVFYFLKKIDKLEKRIKETEKATKIILDTLVIMQDVDRQGLEGYSNMNKDFVAFQKNVVTFMVAAADSIEKLSRIKGLDLSASDGSGKRKLN